MKNIFKNLKTNQRMIAVTTSNRKLHILLIIQLRLLEVKYHRLFLFCSLCGLAKTNIKVQNWINITTSSANVGSIKYKINVRRMQSKLLV